MLCGDTSQSVGEGQVTLAAASDAGGGSLPPSCLPGSPSAEGAVSLDERETSEETMASAPRLLV